MTGGFYVHQWEHDIVILMSEARRNLNLDIKISRCARNDRAFYVHQREHDIVIPTSAARRNLNLDIKIPRCAPKEHEESGGCHRERSKAVFCQPRDCFSRFAPSQ